jgi:hypothetical protein
LVHAVASSRHKHRDFTEYRPDRITIVKSIPGSGNSKIGGSSRP